MGLAFLLDVGGEERQHDEAYMAVEGDSDDVDDEYGHYCDGGHGYEGGEDVDYGRRRAAEEEKEKTKRSKAFIVV